MNPVVTKVAVFAVVTVLGVSYTAYRYVGVGAGRPPYVIGSSGGRSSNDCANLKPSTIT